MIAGTRGASTGPVQTGGLEIQDYAPNLVKKGGHVEATRRLNESRDPSDHRNWEDVSTWVWEGTRKTRTINHLQLGHSLDSLQAPAICGGGRMGGD